MESFIFGLLNNLVIQPLIGEFVKQVIGLVVQWWIGQQKAETYAMISDAAALAARAETQEERYAALDKWRAVLSRPRVSQ